MWSKMVELKCLLKTITEQLQWKNINLYWHHVVCFQMYLYCKYCADIIIHESPLVCVSVYENIWPRTAGSVGSRVALFQPPYTHYCVMSHSSPGLISFIGSRVKICLASPPREPLMWEETFSQLNHPFSIRSKHDQLCLPDMTSLH